MEGDRGASDSSKWSLGSLERRASERGGFTAAADANWNPGRAKWTDTARLTQCKRACAPRRHAQDMLVTDTHQPASHGRPSDLGRFRGAKWERRD